MPHPSSVRVRGCDRAASVSAAAPAQVAGSCRSTPWPVFASRRRLDRTTPQSQGELPQRGEPASEVQHSVPLVLVTSTEPSSETPACPGSRPSASWRASSPPTARSRSWPPSSAPSPTLRTPTPSSAPTTGPEAAHCAAHQRGHAVHRVPVRWLHRRSHGPSPWRRPRRCGLRDQHHRRRHSPDGVVRTFTDDADIRRNLRSIGVPTTWNQVSGVAVVGVIVALAAMLVGAILGGALGDRWHTQARTSGGRSRLRARRRRRRRDVADRRDRRRRRPP